MNEKIAEINVKVMSKTKEVLEDIAETGGLSIGEVIDRLVLKLSPDDVDTAHVLILENILITTSRLTQEQSDEAILKVLKVLGDACVEDMRNEMGERFKSVIDKLEEGVG